MLLHLQATQRMWVSSAGPPTTNTLESVCAAGIVPTKKRSSPCSSMNALARAVLSHRNVRMACPIHDVIQQKSRQNSNWRREEIFSSCLDERLTHFDRVDREKWWSQTGSNRRPPACKAGALPTELWPRAPGPETELQTPQRLA